MDLERELELLRESWTETFDQLFVLYEVAKEVSSVLDLDTVLDHIVNHAFLLLEAESAVIFLIDQETKQLVLKVNKNDKGGEVKRTGIIFKVGEGIAGEVARTGKSVLFAHEVSEKQFKADAVAVGIAAPRNLVCVPILLRGGGVIGVIEIVNKKKGTFSSKDRDFLMAIANISALSVENAKVYKQLKSNEAYQAQVISNLPEGFLAINNEGKITHLNPCAQKLLGLVGREDCLGQPCSVLLKDETELISYIKAALLDGQTQKWKEIYLKKTGKPVYLFTFIFRGSDELILGAGAVIQDMVLKRS